MDKIHVMGIRFMSRSPSPPESCLFDRLPDFGKETVRKLYRFAESLCRAESVPTPSSTGIKTDSLITDPLTYAAAAAGFARIFAHFSQECGPMQNKLINGSYLYEDRNTVLPPVYQPSYPASNRHGFDFGPMLDFYDGLPFSYTDDKEIFRRDVRILHQAFAAYTAKIMPDLFKRAADMLIDRLPRSLPQLAWHYKNYLSGGEESCDAAGAVYLCLQYAAREKGLLLYQPYGKGSISRRQNDFASHMVHMVSLSCTPDNLYSEKIQAEISDLDFSALNNLGCRYYQHIQTTDSNVSFHHIAAEQYEALGRFNQVFSSDEMAWLEHERERLAETACGGEEDARPLWKTTATFPLLTRLHFKQALETAPSSLFEDEEHRQTLIACVLDTEKGFPLFTLGDILKSCMPLVRQPVATTPNRRSMTQPGLMSNSDWQAGHKFFSHLFSHNRPKPDLAADPQEIPLFWYQPFQDLGLLSESVQEHADAFLEAQQVEWRSYGGSTLPSLNSNSAINTSLPLRKLYNHFFYSPDNRNAAHRLGFLWTQDVLRNLVPGFPAKKRSAPSLYRALYEPFFHRPGFKLPTSLKLDSPSASDQNRAYQAGEMAAMSVLDAAAAWKLPVGFFTGYADLAYREPPLQPLADRKGIRIDKSLVAYSYASYGEEVGKTFLRGHLTAALQPILEKHLHSTGDMLLGWHLPLDSGDTVFFIQDGGNFTVLDTVAQLWECAIYPDLCRHLLPKLADDVEISEFIFDEVIAPAAFSFRSAPERGKHIYQYHLFNQRHEAAQKAYACLKDIFTHYPQVFYLTAALYPLHNMPLSGGIPEMSPRDGSHGGVGMQPLRLPCLPRRRHASAEGLRTRLAEGGNRMLSHTLNETNRALLSDAVFLYYPALKTRAIPDGQPGYITPVQAALEKGATVAAEFGSAFRLNLQHTRPEHSLHYHAQLKKWEPVFAQTEMDKDTLVAEMAARIQDCLARQYSLLAENMAEYFADGCGVFDSHELAQVLTPCFTAITPRSLPGSQNGCQAHIEMLKQGEAYLARHPDHLRSSVVTPGSLWLEILNQAERIKRQTQRSGRFEHTKELVGYASSFDEPVLHANVLQYLVWDDQDGSRTQSIFRHRDRIGCAYVDSVLRFAVFDPVRFDGFLQETVSGLERLATAAKTDMATLAGSESAAYLLACKHLDDYAPRSIGLHLLNYAAAAQPELVFETEQTLVEQWWPKLSREERFEYLNPIQEEMVYPDLCDVFHQGQDSADTLDEPSKAPPKEAVCFHLQRAVLAGFSDVSGEPEEDIRFRGLLASDFVRRAVETRDFSFVEHNPPTAPYLFPLYNCAPKNWPGGSVHTEQCVRELFSYANARKMHAIGLNSSIFTIQPNSSYGGEVYTDHNKHTLASLTVREELADLVEQAVYEVVGAEVSAKWAQRWEQVLPRLNRVSDVLIDGRPHHWQGDSFSRYLRTPVLPDNAIAPELRMKGDYQPVGIVLPYTKENAEQLQSSLNNPVSLTIKVTPEAQSGINHSEGKKERGQTWFNEAEKIHTRPASKTTLSAPETGAPSI